MSGLEIGLIVAVVVLGIAVVVLEIQRYKAVCGSLSISKIHDSNRIMLEDANAKLSLLDSERKINKRRMYTVLFKDSEGKDAIEEFNAVAVCFDYELVNFTDEFYCIVFSIKYENFISYKAELVDIDKKEE